MRIYQEIKETTNSYIFNKLHKKNLESNKEISCCYCRYHRGENDDKKFYGEKYEGDIRYPNWKLYSKNKKQWMFKNLEFKFSRRFFSFNFLEIKI